MSRESEKHNVLDDDAIDTVISYAFGLLEPEERAGFERHLESGCRACGRESKAFIDLGGSLSLAAPPVAPPAALRERVSGIPHASHVVRAEEGGWKAFSRGVKMKVLDFDPVSRNQTLLCRIDPGAIIPAHHHWGREQCFVVEGAVTMHGQVFHAGDYVRELAGSDHPAISSENGCVLLLVSNAADEMSSSIR